MVIIHLPGIYLCGSSLRHTFFLLWSPGFHSFSINSNILYTVRQFIIQLCRTISYAILLSVHPLPRLTAGFLWRSRDCNFYQVSRTLLSIIVDGVVWMIIILPLISTFSSLFFIRVETNQSWSDNPIIRRPCRINLMTRKISFDRNRFCKNKVITKVKFNGNVF